MPEHDGTIAGPLLLSGGWGALGIQGGSTEAFAPVMVEPTDPDRRDQQLTLEPQDDGRFVVRFGHSLLVATVKGGVRWPGLGARLVQAPWAGLDHQRFDLVPGEDGAFGLVAGHSALPIVLAQLLPSAFFSAPYPCQMAMGSAADGAPGDRRSVPAGRWLPATANTVLVYAETDFEGSPRHHPAGPIAPLAGGVGSLRVPPGLQVRLVSDDGRSVITTRDLASLAGLPVGTVTSVVVERYDTVEVFRGPNHTGDRTRLGPGERLSPSRWGRDGVGSLRIPHGVQVGRRSLAAGPPTRWPVRWEGDVSSVEGVPVEDLVVVATPVPPARRAGWDDRSTPPPTDSALLFADADLGGRGVALGVGLHDVRGICSPGQLGSLQVPPGLEVIVGTAHGTWASQDTTYAETPAVIDLTSSPFTEISIGADAARDVGPRDAGFWALRGPSGRYLQAWYAPTGGERGAIMERKEAPAGQRERFEIVLLGPDSGAWGVVPPGTHELLVQLRTWGTLLSCRSAGGAGQVGFDLDGTPELDDPVFTAFTLVLDPATPRRVKIRSAARTVYFGEEAFLRATGPLGQLTADASAADASTFELEPSLQARVVFGSGTGTEGRNLPLGSTTLDRPAGTTSVTLELPRGLVATVTTRPEPTSRLRQTTVTRDQAQLGAFGEAVSTIEVRRAPMPAPAPMDDPSKVPQVELRLHDGRAHEAVATGTDPEGAAVDGLDGVPTLIEGDPGSTLVLELSARRAKATPVTLELRCPGGALALDRLRPDQISCPTDWTARVVVDRWSGEAVVLLEGLAARSPRTFALRGLEVGDDLLGRTVLSVWYQVGPDAGPLSLPVRIARRGRTPVVSWPPGRGGEVTVSRNLRHPVRNRLELAIANPDPLRPLVDPLRPWGRQRPTFTFRFDPPAERPNDRGALWTQALVAAGGLGPIELVGAGRGAWTAEGGDGGPPVWHVQPSDANHEVLGAGEVLIVRFDDVVSDVLLDAQANADTTQLYVTWRDLPGIDDGTAALPISRVDRPHVRLAVAGGPEVIEGAGWLGTSEHEHGLGDAPLEGFLDWPALAADLDANPLTALPGAPWVGARSATEAARALDSAIAGLAVVLDGWRGTGRRPPDGAVPSTLLLLVHTAFGWERTPAEAWALLGSGHTRLRALRLVHRRALDDLDLIGRAGPASHRAVIVEGDPVRLSAGAVGVHELRLSYVSGGDVVTVRSRPTDDGWERLLAGPHYPDGSTTFRLDGYDAASPPRLVASAEVAVETVGDDPRIDLFDLSPARWNLRRSGPTDVRLAWRTRRTTEVELWQRPQGTTDFTQVVIPSAEAGSTVVPGVAVRTEFELRATLDRELGGPATTVRASAIAGRGVAGDLTGDGRVDPSLWRPADASWHTLDRKTGQLTSVRVGKVGDVPVPGDYRNLGHTSRAVWRPAPDEGGHERCAWFLEDEVIDGVARLVPLGVLGSPGDIPVPADYDGDGHCDLAVYRPTTGELRRRKADLTGKGVVTPVEPASFGISIPEPVGGVPQPAEHVPVPGDFDGDGIAELALYRPSSGTFDLTPSAAGEVDTIGRGGAGPNAVPVPGDFDARGQLAAATWEPPTTPAPVPAPAAWSVEVVEAPLPPPRAPAKVKVFAQVGRAGTPTEFSVGDRELVPEGWNDLVRSVEVPPGMRVLLFLQSEGDSHPAAKVDTTSVDWVWDPLRCREVAVLEDSVDDLATVTATNADGNPERGLLDGQATRIAVVWAGRTPAATVEDAVGVTLYPLPGFSGTGRTVSGGEPDLDAPLGSALLGSVRVPPGWTVVLREGGGTTGRALTLTADCPALPGFDGPGTPDGWTAALLGTPTGRGTATWHLDGLVPSTVELGQPGDIPVPGDNLGTGRTTLAVFRPVGGRWLFHPVAEPLAFGRPGDVPVSAPPHLVCQLSLAGAKGVAR